MTDPADAGTDEAMQIAKRIMLRVVFGLSIRADERKEARRG